MPECIKWAFFFFTYLRVLPKLVSVSTEKFFGEDVLQTEMKWGRGLNLSNTKQWRSLRSVLPYQSMMLVERAAEKPSMLKLTSVAVQRARPAMTGNRDRFTHSPATKCVSTTSESIT